MVISSQLAFQPAPVINVPGLIEERSVSTHLGRACFKVFSTASNVLHILTENVKWIALRLFSALNAVCSDPSQFFHIFRRLHGEILPYIELKKGTPDRFSDLNKVIVSSITVFDTLQVASGIDYFVNAKFKKDSASLVTANAFQYAAYLCHSCKKFLYLGVIKLEKAAQLMGNLRVFNVSGTLFGVSSACFAFGAFEKLPFAKTDIERNHLQLDLAKNLVDLALYSMIFSGCFSLCCLFLMGSLSITLGITSLLYKREHIKELS